MRKALVVIVCAASLALLPAASAGAATSWSVSPETYDFAPRAIGIGPSAPAAFTVTNTGTTTLPAPDFGVSRFMNENEPEDRFQLTNHCQAGLAPGESCSFEVTFEPTVYGTDTVFLGLSTYPEGQRTSLLIRLTRLGGGRGDRLLASRSLPPEPSPRHRTEPPDGAHRHQSGSRRPAHQRHLGGQRRDQSRQPEPEPDQDRRRHLRDRGHVAARWLVHRPW